MPIDSMTLPHAQSTISRCTQWQSRTLSVFTRQQHLSILTALCYTDQQLPAFSTHVYGEAQTSLVWCAVDMFYKQIHIKSTTSRTSI